MIELSRTDVVVLFDYHRYQRSAADLASRVHRAGATVLLITDDLACPVAPEAEVVLAASSTVGTDIPEHGRGLSAHRTAHSAGDGRTRRVGAHQDGAVGGAAPDRTTALTRYP